MMVFFPPVIFLMVHDEQLTEFVSLCKFYCGKGVHNAAIYVYFHTISLFANEVFYRNMQCKHTIMGKYNFSK